MNQLTFTPEFFILLAISFFLNIPFGYWRGGERKFSWQWFTAIHLPVVLLAICRVQLGVNRNWLTVVILLAVFVLAQHIGVVFRRKRESRKESGA